MYWQLILAATVVVLAILSRLEVDSDPEIASRSVVLTGTPTEVYRYVSDFKLYAKWLPTVFEYESLDERSMSVGKQFTQLSYIPWLGERRRTILIIDYDPPRYLAYIEDSWSLPKVEIFVERIDDQYTRLTWSLQSRWRNYLFKYVGAPTLNLWHDSLARQAMLKLRFHFQS